MKHGEKAVAEKTEVKVIQASRLLLSTDSVIGQFAFCGRCGEGRACQESTRVNSIFTCLPHSACFVMGQLVLHGHCLWEGLVGEQVC